MCRRFYHQRPAPGTALKWHPLPSAGMGSRNVHASEGQVLAAQRSCGAALSPPSSLLLARHRGSKRLSAGRAPARHLNGSEGRTSLLSAKTAGQHFSLLSLLCGYATRGGGNTCTATWCGWRLVTLRYSPDFAALRRDVLHCDDEGENAPAVPQIGEQTQAPRRLLQSSGKSIVVG